MRDLRQVVAAAPIAIVVADGAGRIILANDQGERLFGYDAGELLGRPVEMLVPERFRDAHPILRGGYAESPESRPMGAGRDLYGLRKDGTEVPIEIGLNPVETDDGRVT
ncbi:MAG TPA: PAS domain S-box protein, partial [Candidatus Limnocylindrales bacterium]|nr:PAS domain S-box protein [Candidatus Limnocylindrales bacterium]